MTPEKIRKYVEEYPDLLNKKDKFQDRLISFGGRDSDQEILLMQRLQSIEQIIDFIDYSIYDGEFLSTKEAVAVEFRTRKTTYKEIGEAIFLTKERVRQILESAYRKMADAFNN